MSNKKFNDKDPPGYRRFSVHRFKDGLVAFEELLLPANEQTRQYVETLKQQAEALYEDHHNAKDSVKLASLTTQPGGAWARGSKKPAEELDIDDERKQLQTKAKSDSRRRSQGHTPVYRWDEPLKLIAQGKSASFDSDVRSRGRELYLRLKAKGHLRQIAQRPAVPDTLLRLENLRASQPHFGAVIDLVRDQVLLSQARKLPLRLPAILLLGEPGVGKTHFSQALAADVFSAPIRRHALDTATTESALLGSDKRWSNSTHGLVFEAVCLGDHANPIILLDEIDKALKDSRVDPLAPLHTLLEPITTSKVRDISVDLEFDCSHIIWIATANDAARIPAPLRSRFAEFYIESPRGAMALQVARVMAQTVHARMAVPGFDPVGQHIVKLIAHLSAREQRQALERAFAAAIVNGRSFLSRQDLPLDVHLEGMDPTGNSNGNDSNPQSSGWLH